jgi:leucyl-tRNA synthetase
MELVNAMYKYKDGEVNAPLFRFALKMLLTLLAPFTPHICSEMWEHMGFAGSVHDEAWPQYDESAMQRSTVEIVVQINGKVKARMDVDPEMDRDALGEFAMADEQIKALLEGKNVMKVIAVPGKLVNIVAK